MSRLGIKPTSVGKAARSPPFVFDVAAYLGMGVTARRVFMQTIKTNRNGSQRDSIGLSAMWDLMDALGSGDTVFGESGDPYVIMYLTVEADGSDSTWHAVPPGNLIVNGVSVTSADVNGNSVVLMDLLVSYTGAESVISWSGVVSMAEFYINSFAVEGFNTNRMTALFISEFNTKLVELYRAHGLMFSTDHAMRIMGECLCLSTKSFVSSQGRVLSASNDHDAILVQFRAEFLGIVNEMFSTMVTDDHISRITEDTRDKCAMAGLKLSKTTKNVLSTFALRVEQAEFQRGDAQSKLRELMDNVIPAMSYMSLHVLEGASAQMMASMMPPAAQVAIAAPPAAQAAIAAPPAGIAAPPAAQAAIAAPPAAIAAPPAAQAAIAAPPAAIAAPPAAPRAPGAPVRANSGAAREANQVRKDVRKQKAAAEIAAAEKAAAEKAAAERAAVEDSSRKFQESEERRIQANAARMEQERAEAAAAEALRISNKERVRSDMSSFGKVARLLLDDQDAMLDTTAADGSESSRNKRAREDTGESGVQVEGMETGALERASAGPPMAASNNRPRSAGTRTSADRSIAAEFMSRVGETKFNIITPAPGSVQSARGTKPGSTKCYDTRGRGERKMAFEDDPLNRDPTDSDEDK